MPKGDHCAMFCCSNDRRYPEKQVVKPHVGILRFHSPPNVQDARKWKKLINRGDFIVKLSTKVCSNHFKGGFCSKVCSHAKDTKVTQKQVEGDLQRKDFLYLRRPRNAKL